MARDVYKGELAVYELVCTPILQADATYGCAESAAWSLRALQSIPAVGLSDLTTTTFNQDGGIVTMLAAVSRKSHASISSYDQSTYDVPSYVYIWNATTSHFDVLQVIHSLQPACMAVLPAHGRSQRVLIRR